jgi:Domain of unknown function (DUF4864)
MSFAYRIRIVLIACVALAGSAFSVRADDAARANAQEIIRSQIEAFKSGQDALAYSFASPTIQGFFPDVPAFIDMVKRGYAPVYSPRNYDFGRVKEPQDGTIVQELLVTGPDGKPWTALYTLVRQPDGSWKINSVQVLAGDDSSA